MELLHERVHRGRRFVERFAPVILVAVFKKRHIGKLIEVVGVPKRQNDPYDVPEDAQRRSINKRVNIGAFLKIEGMSCGDHQLIKINLQLLPEITS